MKIQINPQYESCRAYIERIPHIFEQSGKLLFRGRNTIKVFPVPDADGAKRMMVVKRFKRPNFFQKVAYSFFCASKARRAYDNALVLLQRGFHTPQPFAYIETWRGGLIDYCYFVSDIDTSVPICQRLNDPEEFDRGLAADFARFAAHLHQQGIIDVDLNSTNVLYRTREDGHHDFSLIDINRMKIYAEGCFPPHAMCMENLTRFTGRMDLFAYVAKAYVDARRWPQSEVEALIATKRAHDRRWRRRKAFLHSFKRRK